MNDIMDDEYKKQFEDLVERYNEMLNTYYEATRSEDCQEPGSEIAFDMSDLFKHAKEVLPDDVNHPYGFAEFEKEYMRLKKECFGDDCADEISDETEDTGGASEDNDDYYTDMDDPDYDTSGDDLVEMGISLEDHETVTMDMMGKNIRMIRCSEIKVRGYHLDFYGHVNNARYLELMEEARWSMLDTHIDLDSLLHRGVIFAVVNININYRKTVGLGEVLELYVGLLKIGNKSATLYQDIRLKGTDTVVADAEVTFVLANAETGKAVPIDDEFKELFSRIQ